ncbi:hypothetical protein AB0M39_00155 [Streptomyces sp. NPDC051907]|uniref:hypothetical protein n=1 Tax=Streptomyces sp. NPDC051907 TaxID=3155284 RepID=UPI00343476B5
MNRSETDETTDTTDAAGTAAGAAKGKTAEQPAQATATTKATTPVDTAKPAGAPAAEAEDAIAADDAIEQPHRAEGGAQDDTGDDLGPSKRAAGIGAAASGIVSAALGVIALSGSWVGRIAAERQTLVGQIETSQGGNPAEQIAAIYSDAWHTTALVNGIFALLALIVGVLVLAWPQRAGWVRAFAVAGVVLGVLGLIVSTGMYFDLFLDVPSAGAPTGP